MADMELVWEFANDGVWTRYDDDIQEKIRWAKDANLAQVEVSPYHMLDFAQCRQFHKGDSSRWRGVQMVQIPQRRPERPGPLDGSSRVSPKDSRRAAPDCNQGMFEAAMQRCSMVWRCCVGEAEPVNVEEVQMLTLLTDERVLPEGEAMAVADAPGVNVQELQWEFKADGPGWHRYPVEVNASINKAYHAGQSQVEVPSNYIINFVQGRQMKKSDISRWRAVRSQAVDRISS